MLLKHDNTFTLTRESFRHLLTFECFITKHVKVKKEKKKKCPSKNKIKVDSVKGKKKEKREKMSK